jgi:secreted trypsin-like serine protease
MHLALALAIALLGQLTAGPARADASIIGGPALGDPTQAPWLAKITASSGTSSAECTGTIISASQVLTAAHCTFSNAGTSWPLTGYSIAAGIVSVAGGADNSRRQVRTSTGVLVHPGYAPGSPADDVAVITVSSPFDLSGQAVQPIAVAAAADAPGTGATARVHGWGETSPGATDARAHVLDQALLRPSQCAGGVPSLLCAVSAAGTTCSGDSGAGLTALDGRPRVFAVLSFSVEGTCSAGTHSGYTDLTTHEIADWLAGDATPPAAPRGTRAPAISGEPFPGATLTCTPAAWTSATSQTTGFVDGATYAVLEAAAPTYVVTRSDLGRDIACLSTASGAGGSTEWRSGSFRVTERPVPPPPVDPGLSFTIGADGELTVRSTAAAILALELSLTDSRGAVKRLRFASDRPPATVLPLSPGRYRACLSAPATGIFAAANVCRDWTRAGRAAGLVGGGAVRRVRGHRFAVTVIAASPVAGKRVTVIWRVVRCKTCTPHLYKRHVKIGTKKPLISPPIKPHRSVRLDIKVPEVRIGDVPYRAGTAHITVGRRR